jgi:hypothetical protein
MATARPSYGGAKRTARFQPNPTFQHLLNIAISLKRRLRQVGNRDVEVHALHGAILLRSIFRQMEKYEAQGAAPSNRLTFRVSTNYGN